MECTKTRKIIWNCTYITSYDTQLRSITIMVMMFHIDLKSAPRAMFGNIHLSKAAQLHRRIQTFLWHNKYDYQNGKCSLQIHER